MVAKLLGAVVEDLRADIQWVDVPTLNMKFCTGCMACRGKGTCILPEDDAHLLAARIREADALVVGTPTCWGNMSGPLKVLFDRTVPVFMGESLRGIPIPRQKGKRALIITACTTPWPFNIIFPQSRGAIRAIKEVLRTAGYSTLASITRPGSRTSDAIPHALLKKAKAAGLKLIPA